MNVYLLFAVGNGSNPKPSTAQVHSELRSVFQSHKDTYDNLLKDSGFWLRKNYGQTDQYSFEEYMESDVACYHMPAVYCIEVDAANPPKQNKRIPCKEIWEMFKKEGFV